MKEFLQEIGQDKHALMSMFDSIDDLVFLLKVDGNSFRYVYINKKGKRILDYPGEIIGRKIEDIVSRRMAHSLLEKYQQAFNTQKAVYFEETITGKNGVPMIGETSINPIITERDKCEYLLSIVRDVTDRRTHEFQLKTTQRRLVRNQKRIESLFKHNHEAVFELDLQGNFISINDAGERLIGYNEDEIIGRSSFSFVKEEDRNRVETNFANVLNGQTRDYEIRTYHKSGRQLLLHIRNIPIIVDESLEGIFGIASDITVKREMEKELERIKNELQLVWDNTSDGIFLLSQKGRILTANPSFLNMFRYSAEELRNIASPFIFPPHDMTNQQVFLERLRSEKEILEIEVQRFTKTGKVLDILASYRPINEGDILAVGMYKDITERKKMERQLEESEKRYRKIVDLSPEAIMILKRRKILYVNQTGEELLQQSHKDYIVNHFITDFIHKEDQGKAEQFLSDIEEQMVEDSESDTITIRFIRHDGKAIHTELTAALVENGGDKVIQTIIRDISERIEHEKHLSYLAYHDPLTGLLNRRAFNDQFKDSIMEANRNNQILAVFYLDMDNFKEINDKLGHDVGDQLLKEFANRLERTVRGKDLLCRVGGDEFLILLKNITDKKDVIDIASRLHEIVQKPYEISGKKIQVTSSFGISLYPDDGTTPRRLIHHADVALYRAKKERNNYSFY
ncbi:PAS domain S-box protein [Ornithinibacillus caprae]|nr:PAS domain S-box protein [Ornithinibacillus caprae]